MSSKNAKSDNARKETKNSQSVQKKVTKPSDKKVANKQKESINSSKNNKTNVKQVEVETRSSLQQKIKFLEEELEKFDLERTRLTQELDRVCEQKDNQIRELKTSLHEKQLEIDHQMSSFRKQTSQFEEELDKYKTEIQEINSQFEAKQIELKGKNESLEQQLFDLNDYIANKEQTMAKIRELEEMLKQERVFHQRIKDKLNLEIENEKQRVEKEVVTRVNEITSNLEACCMQKLSIDARVALEKFVELSKNYEFSEADNGNLRKENKYLKSNIHSLRIHLEVAESLLYEMLKQLNRRIHNKKDMSVQSDANNYMKVVNMNK